MCCKKLLYMKEIKKGDVYLFQLNDSYDHVQSGRRPCVVVQNNLGNTFSPTLIVVPLTTKIKKPYMPVHIIVGKGQMALCECILTISKKQIINYIKTLDEKTMKLIDRALSISLGFEKEEELSKN